MHLTIVETGWPPEAIRAKYPGGYPKMFDDLLRPELPELQVETISIIGGDAFPDPASLQSILITGSAFGVYDDTPWMRTLKEWIGFAAEAETPMIGICFGHQVIADALGGHVAKSDRGWGIGRHTYALDNLPRWLQTDRAEFALGVSHQDQILQPPADASVIARSEFAAFAGLSYARAPIVTFQGHPEFEDDFLRDLYDARRGNPLRDDQIADAHTSFEKPHDNRLVAGWLADFLKVHV